MEADYIVVGAGSAGCVVAARLSETGSSVILLEAGPKDSLIWIHIPAGTLKLLYNPKVNWNYSAEGGEGSDGRRIHWPRGRTLGGSSSINGMLYVRGNPADFDGWAQMGCRGWSFDDVLPYFRKSEDYKQGDDAEYRGKDGPLKVEDYRTILPLTHKFIEGARQAGHTFRKDLNGREQEGVLWFASRALLVIMWVLGLPLLKSMGLLPSSGRAENAVARFLIASTQAVLLVATLIVGWRVAKATKSYFVFFGVVAACAGAFVIAHLIGLL